MSLFSSPAFRVFNSENSESMVQRKPGANTLVPRKPFLDKTVNTLTPDVNRKQKSSLNIKESIKAPSPTVRTPNLEIFPEDYFSFKEQMEDRCEDLFLHSKRLEDQHVYNILKNYLDDTTPPPSPTSIKLPSFDETMPINSLESSFSSNKSYEEDMFFNLPDRNEYIMKPVDEIDVPVFDIDNI